MTAMDALDLLQRPAAEGIADLRLARDAVARLAGDVADPAAGRRLAVELNDAYLRLQFGFVTDDLQLIRRERQACADLVGEARRGVGAPVARVA